METFKSFAQLKVPAELAKPLLPPPKTVCVEHAWAPMRREPTELASAIAVIGKHWRLSLTFAVLISGTVAVMTFLTKPVTNR